MRILLYWLLIVSTCILAACTSLTTGTISGGAYLNFESGKSEVLRGVEVVLCKYETKSELENDYYFKQLTAKVDDITVDIFEQQKRDILAGTWAKATSSFASKVSVNKVVATKADIDGKYQLEQVPAGSYCLAAVTKVGEQTAFWLVPVSVSAGKNIRVDIDNSNVFFISGRYWGH